MQWLVNLLRGYVEVEVYGAFPERLLNLCAQNGVGFWNLRWVDATTFRFTVSFRTYRQLNKLAQRAMCELRAPREQGLPALALGFRKRYAFVAGLALCILTLSVLSQFILVVDVEGNETVPTAVILEELERLGLKVGAYGPGLEEKEIANTALIELEELSFLAINLHGCRAEVQVREADPAPELLDQTTPADIVATASGIITEMTVTAGQALFQTGDTVVEGEVLITGFMDLPEITFSEVDMGTYIVHATGTVWARTWRTLRAEIPLTAQVKVYTGENETRLALNFLGNRLNFYQNSRISYAQYDKITHTSTLTLWGGTQLPISLIRETARAYTTEPAELNQEEAQRLLEDGLRRDLDEILQETDGECLRTDYTAAVEDGMFTVTLLAECYEQIGKTVEREGDVGYLPGGTGTEENATQTN